MSRAPVVCLLPVRNGARELPGYLDSVARFCDAVVALDDGSLDDTCLRLEGSPLVRVLLSNPRRTDYRAWDDGANRGRLLAAAAELEPDWIISLDADERIDPGDGTALRAFLGGEALAGCAYGFPHFRMWGARSYDPAGHWIYRLFSFQTGQTFPHRKLHFSPIPASIPRTRWLKTTVRVQHFGSRNEQHLLERRRKYSEADPEATFGSDYGGLDRRPVSVRRWRSRPRGLPVLLGASN